MNPHFNSYSVTLLMAGILALLISFVLFQRNHSAIKWFAILILLTGVWATSYSFALAGQTLNEVIYWSNLRYIGIALIPPVWLIFCFKFINKTEWLKASSISLILIVPVITLILVWTNDYHHFYYEQVELNTINKINFLSITRGPWYYVHTVYFYFLLGAGLAMLSSKYRRADKVYKKQVRLIIVGVLIPWIANILNLFGIRINEFVDVTPYAFIATSTVISYGLINYKLFDVIPFARGKVLQGIREGMMVLDPETRVVDMNNTMHVILSPITNDIIGIKLNEILHKEYSLHHIINRKKDSKLEINLKQKNKNRYYEIAITPLHDKENIFIGTLLLFWEITDRKEAAKKLKAQADELEQLNQLKTRIFSIIAHDFRSPLASLQGLLSILESRMISEEEFRAILPSISKHVSDTSTLLENLLFWSKSQLQGEVINTSNFQLKESVQTQIQLLDKKARDKGISIMNKLSESIFVKADYEMISLVIRNLISNAIKFSNNKDQITIRAESQETKTIVCISDTGVGMNKETLDTLFELNVQSKQGTQQEKGTGLGLKLCKDFIEKNKGNIWVESHPGEGSKFYFTLINA
jgi:signal transduction histidine kinase